MKIKVSPCRVWAEAFLLWSLILLMTAFLAKQLEIQIFGQIESKISARRISLNKRYLTEKIARGKLNLEEISLEEENLSIL
ncbi:unnamed protein product [Blepharisma stoltei]|uniref:ATP synthase F0 subunit 8 n=1 Tax=Blepharisma stoltei TaxID=1481888 RepID=A0AAU9JIG8_9CILI|nr:unnamed protein product [Blepharisma stoltei]